MSLRSRFAFAVAACAAALIGASAALYVTLRSTLEPGARAILDSALAQGAGALAFVVLLLIAAIGLALHALFQRYVVEPQRLAEETQLIASANRAHRVTANGAPGSEKLAAAINTLAERMETLERDIDTRIDSAKRDVEQEKTRFAALMSELTDSVIVCNSAAQVLLYNDRAQRLLSTAHAADESAAPALALGRSLLTVVERGVVSHALEDLRDRLERGEHEPVSLFVTSTPGGRTLRVRMAAVLSAAGQTDAPPEMSGFILVLDDITDDVETDTVRDARVAGLIDRTRSGLGNIGAAVDALIADPGMDAAQRERFVTIIANETRTLGGDVASASSGHTSAGPSLENVQGRDLAAVLVRNIERRAGIAVALVDDIAVIWVRVDRFALSEALVTLASRLGGAGVQAVELSLKAQPAYAQLDLAWRDAPISVDVAREWQKMPIGDIRSNSRMSFAEVIRRHGGEAWYSRDEKSRDARFCMLLPLANTQTSRQVAQPIASRPTFYDFDLFHRKGQSIEFDERALADLSYTAFDTETTGLAPSQGDEIVSIGAVHIVNGRLISGEVFEQLVNPRRPLPPTSVRVHGITNDMVARAPPIERVLPAFHRFCQDTVLVAHNAAFDLRFLQLKQDASGLRFDHPVLDTLMLSAVVHPSQTDHTLEAIAARLGVAVIGRHTALGDALLAGEIFLKMLPLLAANGIVTLGQAREAAGRTAYARVGY